MSVKQDAFGHTSTGLGRDKIDIYTVVNAGPEHDHQAGRPPAEDGAGAGSPKGKRSSPSASVRRMSKKFLSKFQKETKEATVSPSDKVTPDPTVLVPVLAPPPPETSEEDRFSEPPRQPSNVPPVKDWMQSPLSTAKQVAHTQGGNDLAENLAKTDAGHEASVKIVRAHAKLTKATTGSEEELALKELEFLKKARQDQFVRWSLDRHIKKAGTLPPPIDMKPRSDFMVVDEDGKKVMQWNEYGKHLLVFYLEHYGQSYTGPSADLPGPTEAALAAAFERVVLTSAPFQDLFMHMRRIAHWEDPGESAIYMVAYLTLLYYDYILRAGLLAGFLMVLERRYFPPTIEDMQQELERAEDRDATPTDLSQHIDQYGGHGWVDPLVEKAGPVVLSHIEDLADFLEILRNFYEWRDPVRTLFTLSIIAMLFIVITLAPWWLLVKGSFFAIGVGFFGLIPMAYRFPRYRLLLSPLIWTFWKIPTHAEWAIARLRAEANHQLETLREQDPSSADEEGKSSSDPIRVGRYHCIVGDRHGKLYLSTDGVSFKKYMFSNESWSVRYENMRSMQKFAGKRGGGKEGDDLLFIDTDGRQYKVSGLKDRDVAFSQIIGYSGTRWQRTG